MTQVRTETPARGRGVFITFEGGDSCGKTTQINLLAERLRDLFGADAVVLTREPGGTELGQNLRQLVLHGPDDVDERCEALLYAADRAYHIATKVRPALAAGKIVLADRYLDSSVAYQGCGRGLGAEWIRHLNEWAVAGLMPDLTLIFDADPAKMAARRCREDDRLEAASDQFHLATRGEFQRIAATYPQRCALIDADQAVEQVAEQIWQIAQERQIFADLIGGESA